MAEAGVGGVLDAIARRRARTRRGGGEERRKKASLIECFALQGDREKTEREREREGERERESESQREVLSRNRKDEFAVVISITSQYISRPLHRFQAHTTPSCALKDHSPDSSRSLLVL